MTATCRIEGCHKPAKTVGLCSGHGHRLRRYGDPEYAPPPRPVSKCSIEGCDGDVRGRGYCRKHYARLLAHGDPLSGGIDYGSAQKFVAETALLTGVSECIAWPFGKNSEGRGRVKINGKSMNADVAILTAAKGDKPTSKHECCHTCGNGHLGCVNPDHLYWGTRKENVADAIRHGTAFNLRDVIRHGELAASAKHSDATIAEIRNRIANGERQIDLAEEYGISKTHINRIWKGLSRTKDAANDNGKKEMAA